MSKFNERKSYFIKILNEFSIKIDKIVKIKNILNVCKDFSFKNCLNFR